MPRQRCVLGGVSDAPRPGTTTTTEHGNGTTQQKGTTVSYQATADVLTTVSDALLARREAVMLDYMKYRVKHNNDRENVVAKELADYYLGIWKGLGEALKLVDAERAMQCYAAYCEAVTA